MSDIVGEMTTLARIRVEPLGRVAWRLSDRTEKDPGLALLAYVEFVEGGAYEAVWVSVRTGTSRHSTLDEVVRTALELLTPPAESRSTKPIPIAHRSPFAPS
ncbi:hypothetical protein ACFVR6_03045 [Microbacterium sp. NPDC058021]|uniref:hypothetical protein n=1 Tax=Microbacterium sp. NPDC058021 TaxID=3346306 RepID=UPI0036DEF55D